MMTQLLREKELRDTQQWARSRGSADSRAARQKIMERLFLTLSPLETLQLRDSMLSKLEKGGKCTN